MTHLIGHAIAHGMKKMERDVGHISWGFFRKSKKIGTSILVDVEGGSDLIPVTIHDGDQWTLR